MAVVIGAGSFYDGNSFFVIGNGIILLSIQVPVITPGPICSIIISIVADGSRVILFGICVILQPAAAISAVFIQVRKVL